MLLILGAACSTGGGQARVATSPSPACAAPPAGTRLFLINPGSSTAQYTAQEKITLPAIKALLKIAGDDNTAVGKTQQLSGQVELSRDLATADLTVTADLRTLDSGVGLRDDRIRQQFLESNTYPWAIFQATGLSVPAQPAGGSPVSFDAPGTMTVRKISKPFTFHVTATLAGSQVTGTATGRLQMSDFGFDPPVIPGAIAVEEGLDLKVDFTATEASCLPKGVSPSP